MDTTTLDALRPAVRAHQNERAASALSDLRRKVMRLSSPLTHTARLAVLSSILTDIKAALPLVPDRALAKRLEILHNKTDSLRGGLQTADYGTNDVAQYRKTVVARLGEFQGACLAYTPPKPKVVKAEPADFTGEDLFKDAGTELKKLSRSEHSLQALRSKNFAYFRQPIIPISSPPLNADRVKAAGLPASKIGFYAVLEDQLVLGLNPAFVAKAKVELKKNLVQLAQHLVELLNQNTKGKYTLLGGPSKHRTGYYFWVVPAAQVNVLRKTVGSSWKVERWGFAFQTK